MSRPTDFDPWPLPSTATGNAQGLHSLPHQ